MGLISGLWGCVDEIPQCELYRTYQYGDEHLRMPCRPQDAHAIAKTENQIWPSYIWNYAENDSGQRHVEGDSYASLRQPPLSHFLLNPFSKLPICLLIVFHRANLAKTHEITRRQNKYFCAGQCQSEAKSLDAYFIISKMLPAVISSEATSSLNVICSRRNTKARMMVMTTLSLSIGATLDTSPLRSMMRSANEMAGYLIKFSPIGLI